MELTHKPAFEPMTIRVVDSVLLRLKEIKGGGGLWSKLVIIVSIAYWNSGY
jgi:hypothetical protein